MAKKKKTASPEEIAAFERQLAELDASMARTKSLNAEADKSLHEARAAFAEIEQLTTQATRAANRAPAASQAAREAG